MESDVRLQRHDHAGEHRGQEDDRDRIDADAHHLPQPFAAFERRAQRPEGRRGEQCEPEAGLFEEADKNAADPFEQVHSANRERIRNAPPSAYTRGTRALMRQNTSYEIVCVLFASSSAVMPSPRRITSSPMAAFGMSVTSIVTRSIDTRPTTGVRVP